MTHKTNIKLKVIEHGYEDKIIQPYCRVKIDGKGFPYIAVCNEKFIITQTAFPQRITVWGDLWATIEECLEGQTELENILTNPELTTDKLTVQQINRISA